MVNSDLGEKTKQLLKEKIQIKINKIFLPPPFRPGRLRVASGSIFRKMNRVLKFWGYPSKSWCWALEKESKACVEEMLRHRYMNI